VLRAELGMIDGHGIGPLGPPAKAKALSAPVFRRRAKSICRRVGVEAVRLEHAHLGLLERIKGLTPGSLTASEAGPLFGSFATRLEEPLYRAGRRWLLDLARLRPPASEEADYRRYLVLNSREAEWLLAQSRALRLGEFKAPFLSHEAAAHANKAERERLAKKLGIAGCQGSASDASSISA
jgi:hypothetical protein